MPATVDILLSIFGLIGVGYAVARTGLLKPEVGDGLSDFVFTVAVPVLLFRTLATADLHGVSPWGVWLVYFAAVAIVWVAGHQLIRRVFGRDVRAGMVAGISAAYSNLASLGIPLIQTVFGEPGMVYLVTLIAINLPVMTLASMVANEYAIRADGIITEAVDPLEIVRGFLLSLATHPILIGIAAGIAWRILGLPIGGAPGAIVASLAQLAGPLALIASGIALQSYGVKRQIMPSIVITVLKLLVMPGLVFIFARLIGLPTIAVQTLTICAACSTGVNAFILASRFGTGQALASNATLISTTTAIVSVAVWLTVLGVVP